MKEYLEDSFCENLQAAWRGPQGEMQAQWSVVKGGKAVVGSKSGKKGAWGENGCRKGAGAFMFFLPSVAKSTPYSQVGIILV